MRYAITYIECQVMEIAYAYEKNRRDFGKHTGFFQPVEATIIEKIPSTDAYDANYVMRNPSVSMFDTAPQMWVSLYNSSELKVFFYLLCTT